MAASPSLEDDEVRSMAIDWYKKLDVHAPLEEVLPFLAEQDLEMRFPEGTTRGQNEFKKWYDTVTNRFFNEVHEMKELNVQLAGDHADVKLVVNWQAHIWDPPAPKSAWLGFDAYQTWVVRRSPRSGKPVIATYIVDKLDPMPGSVSL